MLVLPKQKKGVIYLWRKLFTVNFYGNFWKMKLYVVLCTTNKPEESYPSIIFLIRERSNKMPGSLRRRRRKGRGREKREGGNTGYKMTNEELGTLISIPFQ